MTEMQQFYRALVRVLEPAEATATGIRLVLAQRLELELADLRTAVRAEEESETDPVLSAQRVNEKVRARARSFPRNEDTLARLARLEEPERSSSIAAHLLNFTGTLGDRLRSDPETQHRIARLAEGGAFDDCLTRLLALPIGPAAMTEGGFDRFVREFIDHAAGRPPSDLVLRAVADFMGAAAEGPKRSAAETPSFTIEFEYSPRINWAMERNGVPIIHEVRVTNRTDAEIGDLRLLVRLAPDFSEVLETAIPPLPPQSAQTLARMDLRLSGKRLRDVVENEKAVLEMTLARPSGESVSKTADVLVLAFNEWNARALPELLAAFCLPNHSAISRVLEAARDRLAGATGDPGLAGYASKSIERVRLVARSVYEAMQEMDISYVAPPASFETIGQKIRLPDQVLDPRMGTCIDLTLVMAAAFEQAGLNPLIVLEKGHAYAGVWLVDDAMSMPATVDHETLRKIVEVGDILLFEPTAITARPRIDFAASVAAATARLADSANFETVLDVRAARRVKILPLPVGGASAGPADAIREAPAAATAPLASAAASPAGRPETKPAAPADPSLRRINEWIKRLLDLSMRNRLLAYRESRDKSIVIECPEVDLLEDRLAAGDWLTFVPKVVLQNDPRAGELVDARGGEDALVRERRRLIEAKKIPTTLTSAELSRRLTLMARAARTEGEEKGISTLFMGIGMLKWFESSVSERDRRAPIILYPIEIERRSAGLMPRIRIRDEDPRLNDTLIEKLKQDFDVSLDEFLEMPEDQSGLDVNAILKSIQRLVSRTPRWEVLPEAVLDFFPFTKSIMVDDLRSRTDHLKKNDLFRLLIGDNGLSDPKAFDGAFPAPETLDTVAPPTTAKLVVDADSSQHAAVLAAIAGKSFVLQGPPGTGKSQTITNIIAEMIGRKKRVLFVAEKRAALEVVSNRLAKVGLRDACLELHGKDVSKREVVVELARVLESGGPAAAGADPALAQKVEADVRRLNAYASAVNERRPVGRSYVEMIGRLSELKDVVQVDLDWPRVLDTAEAVHKERLEALREVEDALPDVRPVSSHPFRAFRVPSWTPIRGREWQALFSEVEKTAAALDARASETKAKLSLPDGGTVGGYEAHILWLECLGAGDPGGALALASRPDRDQVIARLDGLVDRLADAQRSARDLFARWEEGLLELDLDQLRGAYRQKADAFFAVRWFALKGPNDILARVAKGPLGKPKDVLDDLENAHRLRAARAALDADAGFLKEALGAHARGKDTDPEFLGRVLSAARSAIDVESRVKRVWPEARILSGPKITADEARALAAGLRADVDRLRAAFEKLKAVFAIDLDLEFGAPLAAVLPAKVRESAARWNGSLQALQPMARFLAAEDRARAAGLDGLLKKLRDGTMPDRDLVRLYERSFFTAYAEQTIESVPELASFDPKAHGAVIERFRGDDVRWISSGGTQIARDLAADRPRPTGIETSDSEVGIILREAKKKTRHLPIRRLLERAPTVIGRLKPCFLMSPLSIAQYLPPEGALFDLVIFDEASQIATHDAVGAVARGRQVIIVGDSKQLPPTTFFTTEFAGDDLGDLDGRVDELESILDECVASRVPSRMLQWHYRSRDESLITFSNHHYYENRLLTFPAGAGGRDFGVSIRKVGGTFDSGKSRTNRKEADAIVAWILEALRDPAQRTRSIGVVTFNQAQQTLIEDLLDQARRADGSLEPYFMESAPEPLFVKNLENVQGDERDVMLFSVTYGPDASGRPPRMHFGPLSISGGERRLNVAITRAREQLVVFSSLLPENIDLAKTRALGAEHLRNFLRYAEEGPRALAAVIRAEMNAAPESPFEKEVAEALRARDHAIDLQVGCSGYRIDIGVKDPAAPGRYVLGIECDGRSYHSAKTARERDRLRESVLRNLGWRIERVWSTDWWQRREDTLARLERAIADALAAPARPRAPGANRAVATSNAAPAAAESKGTAIVAPPPAAEAVAAPPSNTHAEGLAPIAAPPAAPPSGTSSAGAAPAVTEEKAPKKRAKKADEPAKKSAIGGEPYRPYAVTRSGDLSALMDEAKTAAHMTLMKAIIECEGPVHRDLVFDRMARSFDIGRLTTRVEDRLLAIAARLVMAAEIRAIDAFYWPPALDPANYDRVREKADDDDDPRDLEHIPPQEMSVAVRRILEVNVGMPKDQLVRSTVTIFGWKRVTPRAQSAVERGIEMLLAEGRCRVDGDHLRVITES